MYAIVVPVAMLPVATLPVSTSPVDALAANQKNSIAHTVEIPMYFENFFISLFTKK